MTYEFEVVACHGDHAGKAHLAIRCLDESVEIAIQHMSFEADPTETLAEEQARILSKAARLAQEAVAFLRQEATKSRSWPTQCAKLGASPKDGEAPNAFGFPIPRA
jgi:hypothetical protein